jgi:hypothetical protein
MHSSRPDFFDILSCYLPRDKHNTIDVYVKNTIDDALSLSAVGVALHVHLAVGERSDRNDS